MAPEILFEAADGVGTITLNRPRALNTLTADMVTEMRRQFTAWLSDPAIRAFVIKGAGDRAFCAGGNVLSIRQAILENEGRDAPPMAQSFFFEEYILNHQIHTCPKPYVAMIDGICMGGGVGLSIHGSWRVVSERARFAMPETGIGLFPDVGGGWFLSRLPGQTGIWLGLSGTSIRAADCHRLGIATHVVPSDRLAALETDLHAADLSDDAHAVVRRILDRYAVDPGPAPVDALRDEIDQVFAGDDAEAMMDRLSASDTEFARETRDALATKSPTSVKVALEQIRRAGRAASFAETMTMEYRLSQHFVCGHDFPEGIRALLVDRDNRPDWQPARLTDVTDALVASYFEPVPWRELTIS